METLTLSAPISVTGYSVRLLILDWGDKRIKVLVQSPTGETVVVVYLGTEATNLMVLLNKADMSTLSLHRRVLQKLVTDGKLPAGTVTGSPD